MAQRTALMLLVLYTLLIIGLLVLVVSGAHLYAVALDTKDLHAQQRSALSFLQTQVASCRGGVSLVQEDDAVILRLADKSYETNIYLYENSLCSQLVRKGAEMDPAKGETICPMERFALTWVNPELLMVETDCGTAYIRCGGGEANG